MIKVESVLKVLLSVLNDAAVPSDPNQYQLGIWGKAQGTIYSPRFALEQRNCLKLKETVRKKVGKETKNLQFKKCIFEVLRRFLDTHYYTFV